MKKLTILSALLVFPFLTACNPLQSVPSISVEDAAILLASTNDVALIDVRTMEERIEGVLPDADFFLDVQDPAFREKIGTLPKDADYIVYCRSGSRSKEAVAIMQELGFTSVQSLNGGYEAWVEKYPLADSATANVSGDSSLEQILVRAMEDELRAEKTYQVAIQQFGDMPPFSAIIHAEIRHSQSIEQLLAARGMRVPVVENVDPSTLPATKKEMCNLAAKAEIENIALYDVLLDLVQDEPDVFAVFTRLQAASREKHLPAFERCAR